MALRKTLLEMTTAVRIALDEVSPSFWGPNDIQQFLNRAKDRVHLEVRRANQGYFEMSRSSLDGSVSILGESYDCANFRIVPGTRDFTLPPDFATLVSNRSLTSSYEWLRLSYRRHSDPDFRDALEETTAQTPRFYTLMGERTLRIAPLSDMTLEWALTYVYIVPDLTSTTSTLEMPHPLYMAVEQYATAEALMKDHSPDAAAWEAKGNATIALFLGTNERQGTDVEHVQGYLEW
ncbi:MAG TPA: hypothetical protein VJ816_03185 [Gemmatimonadales bacterium]|nr:hypothetical protein [Gemmatimonadales bacterium]